MTDLAIWTYDWVPNGPRGFVRDLQLRWACEEAGLACAVRTVAFDGRGPEHLARQPFGQVPFLTAGKVTLFESGACLLHLTQKSAVLMLRESPRAAEVPREGRVRALGARPASEAYVARVTGRPAFRKVHADQLALFAAAD